MEPYTESVNREHSEGETQLKTIFTYSNHIDLALYRSWGDNVVVINQSRKIEILANVPNFGRIGTLEMLVEGKDPKEGEWSKQYLIASDYDSVSQLKHDFNKLDTKISHCLAHKKQLKIKYLKLVPKEEEPKKDMPRMDVNILDEDN